jgi:hypothetical protein
MLRRVVVTLLVVATVSGCAGGEASLPAPETVVPYTGPPAEDPAGDPRTADPPDDPAAPSSGQDLALAEAVVNREADLPPGWAECCPRTIFDEEGLSEHICGSPPRLPPHTAGYLVQFALDLRPDDLGEGYLEEDGHLTSTVLVAATAADAAEEWTAVDSSAYEGCLLDSVHRMLRDHYVVDPDLTELTSSYRRIDLGLDVPTVLDRVFTDVVGPDGPGGGGVLTYRVRALVGRVIVRLEIVQHTEEMPVDEVRAILGSVIERAERRQARA